MNKCLLIAVIFLAMSNMSSAQFGLKAGFNLSHLSGNNDLVANQASRVGFQGGLMYKIPLKEDWLSVQPELIYILKGGAFHIDQLKLDAKLDYIELPVMAVFNVFGGNLNFQAGPQFSYLTKVTYTVADETGQSETLNDKDLSNYNTFDIGLALGIGLELEIVMFELRYSVGFLALEKGFEYNGQFYDPSSKSFNAQLLFGYFF